MINESDLYDIKLAQMQLKIIKVILEKKLDLTFISDFIEILGQEKCNEIVVNMLQKFVNELRKEEMRLKGVLNSYKIVKL